MVPNREEAGVRLCLSIGKADRGVQPLLVELKISNMKNFLKMQLGFNPHSMLSIRLHNLEPKSVSR